MIRKISVLLVLLALLMPISAFARKGHLSSPPKAVKYSVKKVKVKKHRRVKRVRRAKHRHPKIVTLVQPADRAAV